MEPRDAAVMLASRLGLGVEDPFTLHDSNNVVVWLRPVDVVAKVATGHHRRLGFELDVGLYLASVGAPVVPPAAEVPPEVYRAGGFEVTFWAYQPHDGRPAGPLATARALLALHEALDGYPGRLPPWTEELHAVSAALDDVTRAPALQDHDRQLLRSSLSRLREELQGFAVPERALYGSPHDGNALSVRGGVRFIDFETACRGPVEWDLAHIDRLAVRAYQRPHDHRLLALCANLASVKTAAWCWANYDNVDLRWHAQHHLGVARRFMAG